MQVDICERTFEFAKRIVGLCRELGNKPGPQRTMVSQVLRSGTSVGANVEEAQSGQSRADFLSKMQIACKEARETHYWLRLLVGTGIVSQATLAPLLQEADELVAILTTIIRRTKDRSSPPSPPCNK